MIIKLANQAMLDAWGKTSDVINIPYSDALPELHGQGVFEQLQHVFTTGEAFHAKNQPLDLLIDGAIKTCYFNYSFTAVRDRNNVIYGVMNTGADVTDLAVAKQKIEESEYQTKQLILESPIATCLFLGPEMKIELLNKSMMKLWGKGESIIGKTIREALPELEGQPFFDLFDEVYRTGVAHSDTGAVAHLMIDGKMTTGYFDYTYKPLRDEKGEVYGIVEVAVDVTDQVLSRRRLEQSEQKFKNLVTHAPVGICIVRREQVVVEVVNNKFLEVVGRTRNEMENRPYWETLSEAEPEYAPLLENTFETEIPFVGEEQYLKLLRNGVEEEFYVNFVYQPLKNELGKTDRVMILVIEVTQQVVARRKIEQSEHRFRSLIAAAPVAIGLYLGPKFIIDTYNKSFEEVLGKGPSIKGRALAEVMPELLTENQPFLKLLEEVYSTGIPYQSNGTLVKIAKNGIMSSNYYDIAYMPLLDEKSEVYAILNVAIDVTENVLAQKTVEKSEKNLRRTILQAPVAMCLFKGESHVVDLANDRILELWGKEADAVLKKPVVVGIPEIIGQGFDKLLDEVYATGETFRAQEVPVRLFRNDVMETIYANFVYEAFREADGTVSGIMAVALDVTKQVLARQKIEQAEEKARLAIESADLGTYETNFATGEIQTSPRFDEIWGIKRDASVNRAVVASKIHPEDAEIRLKAHELSLKTGNLHYEARVIHEDESIHWVRVKGKVIYNDHGDPETLLGIIQDITEQKEFADQLTRLVRERTTELHRSNEDLLQFAHVASHDLKEPVRKIKFFSSMLEDDFGDLLPPRGKTHLQKVQTATDRMFSMIEGVLSYSTMSSSEQAIMAVDLNEVFSHIEQDLEVAVSRKNATIKREHLPTVEGASVLLYQLFYNIINNSLKFSKEHVPPTISITACIVEREREKQAEITITDNGIGLDPDYTNKIFNAFARLHSKDKYEGTGLGLALCKKIVERHHGTISATGVKDESAIFTITLPLRQRTRKL
jgi:hypothetical protein